jgi:hypothetical protein
MPGVTSKALASTFAASASRSCCARRACDTCQRQVDMFSTCHDDGPHRHWLQATGAQECAKIEVPAQTLDLRNIAPSINVGCLSLDVDYANPPIRRRLDGWGAAQMTSGAPAMTLTCTSMPRGSDGNPMNVP